jgi:hypothetical protein
MKKAVTLMELLVAISLLTVVVLASGAFDLTSRRMLQSSERKTAVLNDINYVTDHIQKHISQAIGSYAGTGNSNWPFGSGSGTNFGYCPAATNSGGFLSIHTSSGTVGYSIPGAPMIGNTTFCDNYDTTTSTCLGNISVLSNRIQGSHPGMAMMGGYDAFVVNCMATSGGVPEIEFYVTGLYNMSLPEDPSTNSRVSLNTTFNFPAVSLQ